MKNKTGWEEKTADESNHSIFIFGKNNQRQVSSYNRRKSRTKYLQGDIQMRIGGGCCGTGEATSCDAGISYEHRAPVPVPAVPLGSSSLLMFLRRQQKMDQVLRPLPAMWKMGMEFWASGFELAQPW